MLHFGIQRTVPAGERREFKRFATNNFKFTGDRIELDQNVQTQVEKTLGKDVSKSTSADLTTTHTLYVGSDGLVGYSEFHFGAGESSVIRMVSMIESAPKNSLVLVEEIENGLHPVAARRMVEYLVDAAERRSIQSIFTTHSEDAIRPLPSEAIWSSADGKARQGRISIEALRALTGRIDERVAIYVEDNFAKEWVNGIVRIGLMDKAEEIGVYALRGDGRAYNNHMSHQENPAFNNIQSLCILDGDSSKSEEIGRGVFKHPGEVPGSTVYDYVKNNLSSLAMKLAISMHMPAEREARMIEVVQEVSLSNRDPHLLFNQVGQMLNFTSENIVMSAFISLWIDGNNNDVNRVVNFISPSLESSNDSQR